MSTKQAKMNMLLGQIAEKLDIAPSKYQEAVDRYTNVGNWLDADDSNLQRYSPRIYPQGSFRLGTVVRPWRDGKEAEYDIDLVCKLTDLEKSDTSAADLKKMVGDRLKFHGKYKAMLDKEGRRCWTLEYAEDDGIGFHMDILPSLPEDQMTINLLEAQGYEAAKYAKESISITHTEDRKGYGWRSSNPDGFGKWFDERCQKISDFAMLKIAAKSQIFSQYRTVYASIEKVPDLLVRTPLQRVVQILKRHRDVYFAGKSKEDHKPISMIITVLAASSYNGEGDIFSALTNIVSQITAHSGFVANKSFAIANAEIARKRLIYRTPDGIWQIKNPVNSKENFAERWHEDDAKAKAFFDWVKALSEHFSDIDNITDFSTNNPIGKMLLAGVMPNLKSVSSPSTPHVSITNPAKPWRQ